MAETKGELVVLHDRRDRLEATRLVRKLELAGFRVALKDTPLGQRRARPDAPTVVLWSRHAGVQKLRSVLNSETAIIAKLDGRAAPSADATVTDLRGWRGQDRHQGWKTLLEAVAPNAAPVAPAPKAAPKQAQSAKPVAQTGKAKSTPKTREKAPSVKKGGKGVLLGVLAAIAVAAIGWAIAIYVL